MSKREYDFRKGDSWLYITRFCSTFSERNYWRKYLKYYTHKEIGFVLEKIKRAPFSIDKCLLHTHEQTRLYKITEENFNKYNNWVFTGEGVVSEITGEDEKGAVVSSSSLPFFRSYADCLISGEWPVGFYPFFELPSSDKDSPLSFESFCVFGLIKDPLPYQFFPSTFAPLLLKLERLHIPYSRHKSHYGYTWIKVPRLNRVFMEGWTKRSENEVNEINEGRRVDTEDILTYGEERGVNTLPTTVFYFPTSLPRKYDKTDLDLF